MTKSARRRRRQEARRAQKEGVAAGVKDFELACLSCGAKVLFGKVSRVLDFGIQEVVGYHFLAECPCGARVFMKLKDIAEAEDSVSLPEGTDGDTVPVFLPPPEGGGFIM